MSADAFYVRVLPVFSSSFRWTAWDVFTEVRPGHDWAPGAVERIDAMVAEAWQAIVASRADKSMNGGVL